MSERFGKYELTRRLAFGGMAEIFLGSLTGEQGFAKKVVLKRILPQFSADPDFVQMFVDEAVIAARLTHANIVQVYDFGEVGGTYFIAMEWVDGIDLSTVVRRQRELGRRMGAAEVAAIGEGVCRGLGYAHNFTDDAGHAFDIVHRDISPHNIMLSRSGDPKVMDFGIAKASQRATRTATGMIKGKIAYMAPEQAQGLPIDKRVDQFAVGLVLWECLTGQRLFTGDSDMELLRRVAKCEVRPVRELRDDVPEALERVVSRALAQEPADRYPDLADMERDLSAFRFSLGAAGAVRLGGLVDELAPRRATGELAPPPRRTQVLDEEVGDEPASAAGAAAAALMARGEEATASRVVSGGASASGSASAAGAGAPTAAGAAAGGWEGSRREVTAATAGSDSSLAPTVRTPSEPRAVLPLPSARRPWPRAAGLALAALLGIGIAGGAWLWLGARGGEAAAAGPLGTLIVRSVPAGAAIFIDGAEVGLRTPAPIPGRRIGEPLQVELRLEGHAARREVVTLGSATEEVILDLSVTAPPAPPPAAVPASAAAAEAAGEPVVAAIDPGPTPPESSAQPSARAAKGKGPKKGKHGARDDSGGPASADPPGRPGGRAKLSLRAQGGWAEVWLGGRRLGTTPLREVEIPAGTHILKLMNPDTGFKTTLKVSAGPGEHAKETVTLE